VTVPMTRPGLIVNGEIRESRQVNSSEDAVYKRLRLKLTAAYRQLHNEMQRGHYHGHTPLTDHPQQRP
jgi:hypothetical protein